MFKVTGEIKHLQQKKQLSSVSSHVKTNYLIQKIYKGYLFTER